jgi:hypothetical protein
MMRNFLLICTLLLAATTFASAQETLFDENGLGVTGAWYQATYNYSFLDDDYVYGRGGGFGLEFGRSLFVGYAWTRFRDEAEPDNARDFRLKYNGLLLGFTPNSYKAIHPRLNALIGGGKIFLRDGNFDRVFVLQPSAGLEINVFEWFRLGLEGGYRFVSNDNVPGLESEDISSPFAQIDLRFGFSWDR